MSLKVPVTPYTVCVATYSDTVSAEVSAQLLRSEGVDVRLVTDSALLGEARQCEVHVPAQLAHRARWLLAQSPVSDGELEYLATGMLGDGDTSP
jgi:hypothetical protein